MYNSCFLSQQNIYLNSPKEVRFTNDLNAKVDIKVNTTTNKSFYLKDIEPTKSMRIDAKSFFIKSIEISSQCLKKPCLIKMPENVPFGVFSLNASEIFKATNNCQESFGF